jgi:hypothetical protein
MSKPISLPAVVALSILLSGCFSSDEAKFLPESAVAVFGDGGRFVYFEHDGDRYQRKDSFLMKRVKSGYDLANDKGEVRSFSFHDVGNGRFAVQAAPPLESKGGYGYAILIRQGTENIIYIPDCLKQDPKLLATHAVGPIGRFECGIDKVKDPRALFGAVDLGAPTSKLVPE